jgi:thrombospondin type 3 repeat protein
MCRYVRFALLAILAGVFCLSLGTTPVLATCGSPLAIQSGDLGNRLGPACGTTPFLAFWVLTHGNPTAGLGTDSGVTPGFISSDRTFIANWQEVGVDGCVVDFAVGDDLPPLGVIINDGAGENTSNHSGTLLAFSNDFSQLGQFYALDFSLGFDTVTDCPAIPTPSVSGVVPNGGGFDVTASWGAVSTLSDCALNPDSDCYGGSRNISNGYQLYSKEARCTVGPITGARSAWTPRGAQAAGLSATVNVPAASAGQCQFIAMAPVFESGFTVGYLSHTAVSGAGPALAKIGGAGDADGDGTSDATDTCPFTSGSNTDTDGDGYGNLCDNCPSVPNQSQADANGNGVGDACDSCPTSGDSDGDGACDDVDNCPTTANPSQTDSDGDGLGDACDPCPFDTGSGNDSDGDGICNSTDNCPNVANPTQLDTDGDGVGDVCDPCPFERPAAGQVGFNDKDGDGICSCDPVLQNAGTCGVFPNITEGHGTPADNCPRTPNVSQTPSGKGDGLGLACEDKFGQVQVRPTNDQGFGDCRIRFKTVEEWNCPRFQAIYRSPGGDRAAGVSLSCRRCTTGEGFSSAFYGGTAGAYIKYCHGGHDIYAQAVRTVTSSSCPGFVNPNPVAAVRVEKVATRVR